MKITVIMPTYNDGKSIEESIGSILMQSYENWELIIVDDGSTDQTKEIIDELMISRNEYSGKIKYIWQENQDQLAAIDRALPYVTGDYIYILHSDDLIPETDTFSRLVSIVEEDVTYDAYIGNWEIIDENSVLSGYKKVLKYKQSKSRLALLYLWLGRNLYVDVGLFKTSSFKNSIKESYLKWNMPFWVDFEHDNRLLKVKNTDILMYRYRVFSGNYINSELGQLNVLSGELRTLTHLMEGMRIPLYRVQYSAYRLFNKIGLGGYFSPIVLESEEKKKGTIIEFVIRKRLDENYQDNMFLSSLIAYYKSDSERVLVVEKLPEDLPIYLGRDMRKFNNSLVRDSLHVFYRFIFREMNLGFSSIECYEEDVEKVKNLTHFLCIYPRIEIISKNSIL